MPTIRSVYKRSKTKYFLLVTDSLAFFGAQTRKELTSSAGVSLTTLSRVLEVLLDFGVVCEKQSSRSSVFSLAHDKRFLIIILNEAKLVMHVCRLDGSVEATHSAKVDMRYFYNENVSLFLRNCVSFTRKKKIVFESIYIINDPLKNSHRSVYSDSMLKELCTSYFGKVKIHISDGFESARRGAESLIKGSPSLTLTAKDGVLYALCDADSASEKFVPLKNIQTGSILRECDTSPAAVAFALANVLSLFNVKTLLLDAVYPLNRPYFADEFKEALDAFLERDTSDMLNVTSSLAPLAFTGAMTVLRREHVENLLKTQKGMLEYDLLSY